ncbi:uncharacterized protein LOC144144571 [Haemaphysalis longicornis]
MSDTTSGGPSEGNDSVLKSEDSSDGEYPNQERPTVRSVWAGEHPGIPDDSLHASVKQEPPEVSTEPFPSPPCVAKEQDSSYFDLWTTDTKICRRNDNQLSIVKHEISGECSLCPTQPCQLENAQGAVEQQMGAETLLPQYVCEDVIKKEIIEEAPLGQFGPEEFADGVFGNGLKTENEAIHESIVCEEGVGDCVVQPKDESELGPSGTESVLCDPAMNSGQASSSGPSQDTAAQQRDDAVPSTSGTQTNKKPAVEKHQCSLCQATFKVKYRLAAHLRSHTGERPFPCDLCPKTYMSQHGLKNHMMRHTGERPWSCEECSKGYITKHQLKIHIQQQHTGERPFKCDECPKAFVSSANLQVHKRVHSGEKPCACHLCPMSFLDAGTLRNHVLATHGTERPHVCEYCGKSFALRASLTCHVRMHTGDTPYVCHLCPSKFTKSQSLVIHLRGHANERPYHCEQCGKRFACGSRLWVHRRNVHSEKPPYACAVCSTRYRCKRSLQDHMKTKHPDEPVE